MITVSSCKQAPSSFFLIHFAGGMDYVETFFFVFNGSLVYDSVGVGQPSQLRLWDTVLLNQPRNSATT
jgi:hypothetical protein